MRTIGRAFTILFFLCGFYFLFTKPIIERHTGPDTTYEGISFVGGNYSHADVKYIDWRPVMRNHNNPANVWWGATNGEWRRLETLNGFTGRTATKKVLRDIAARNATFGVDRCSKTAHEFQADFNRIRWDYQQQSRIFDRVLRWRVE